MTKPSITQKDMEKANRIELYETEGSLRKSLTAGKDGNIWVIDVSYQGRVSQSKKKTPTEIRTEFNNQMNYWDENLVKYTLELYYNYKLVKIIKGSKGKRTLVK